jgi:hypothetical protein
VIACPGARRSLVTWESRAADARSAKTGRAAHCR